MKNQIEVVKQRVEARIPGVRAVIDEPLKREGPWMLDVDFNDQAVNVEWRPHRGFGVSSRESHGYGEGPDEIFSEIGETVHRIVELLKTRASTATPSEVTLAELRERLRLSQSELAQRLKVSQAAISDIENNLPRSQLRTLRKIVEALGAEIEVRAVLPKERVFTIKLTKEGRLPSRHRVPSKKLAVRSLRKGKKGKTR